ncbi:MAG: AAA family ATPase [Bacteroidales bacterium]|nr:AAA family ATPase [Bacteroidales bacterium]
MKLLSFNIQNYRSIIYSGLCELAHDNITALIGQNESGKTSVLEALHSFYTGNINEDVLRSDLSIPVVSCNFELEKKKIADLLETNRIPTPILEFLQSKKEFTLTRKWKTDRSSLLYFSSDEVLDYFENVELKKLEIENRTQEEINKLLAVSDGLFKEMEVAESMKEESQQNLTARRKKLDEAKKKLRKAKQPDAKLIAEKEFESMQSEYNTAEEDYKKKVEDFEQTKTKTQELSEKVTACKLCNSIVQKVFNVTTELETYRANYREVEHQYEISTSEKDQKSAYSKLQQIYSELKLIEKTYKEIKDEAALQKAIAAKVLSGVKFKQAEVEAENEIQQERELYDVYDLGEILFQYLPVFEFFEDFSSLLPNKIDLEDILNENTNVEGYKAARNFLEVAGLDAAFFREKNHRILKQKIENLNGEITINFQDYWSQNVGRDNKINLNFELEHYDYTHPEKSGKPYLEFWIKDKQERLYPKQRSRGVRWFLSFYLELKATAKKNHVSRVILIDEPGLSLHARAQEDVLKVFEDLKSTMQIIYCTHSPHLINANKLYRILAVQRADDQDDRSETIILHANDLYSASSDTLSPVYSLMGVRIHNQDFIQSGNNIIVEDTVMYYYLNAFCRLSAMEPLPSFIPSTGLTNIPVLSNILLGWKVGFSVLTMGKSRSDEVLSDLHRSIFFKKNGELEQQLLKVTDFEYPEDIFSTLDFKKFVIQKREGITERNSDYILENGLSRTILASQFINYCEHKNITLKDFDDDTRKNIKLLINKIQKTVT